MKYIDHINQNTAKIEKHIAHMRAYLEQSINGLEGDKEHIAYKIGLLRETLYWRTFELSESALMLFKLEKAIPAIFLVRGVMESVALQYKLLRTIQDRKLPDVDPHSVLDRMLNGFRRNKKISDDKGLPEAFQILNLIEKVNKIHKDFEQDYFVLSEYVHPNSSGVNYSFSNQNHKENITIIGKGYKDNVHSRAYATLILNSSLAIYLRNYDDIDALMVEWLKEMGEV